MAPLTLDKRLVVLANFKTQQAISWTSTATHKLMVLQQSLITNILCSQLPQFEHLVLQNFQYKVFQVNCSPFQALGGKKFYRISWFERSQHGGGARPISLSFSGSHTHSITFARTHARTLSLTHTHSITNNNIHTLSLTSLFGFVGDLDAGV